MSTQQVALDTDKLFIGGEWVPSLGAGRIDVISASTEEHVGSVPDGTEADIDAAVAVARRTFDDPQGWSSWESRGSCRTSWNGWPMRSRPAAEETAHRVSMQNGMPISIALQLEAVFPAVVARYYAGLVRSVEFDEERAGLLGGTIRVARKPVGVIAAIVPWNYPQTLAMFKLAPAIAMGWTVVMKPSPETVLDSLAPRRGRRRGGPAGRRAEHRPGGPRGRRLPRRPSGR